MISNRARALIPFIYCAMICAARHPSPEVWPELAERSGTALPDQGAIAALTELVGVYVPAVEGLSTSTTSLWGGGLTWNVRLYKNVGLYGAHEIGRMSWEDTSKISLLTMGHAVGLRYLFGPILAFEAGYLGHRVEYEWVDGDPWSLGGVFDHGAEVGILSRFAPMSRLRVKSRLLGRVFAEPKSENAKNYSEQLVYGLDLSAEIMPIDGHVAVLGIEVLRVYRGPMRREGVEEITWNVVGKFLWRSLLTDHLGWQVSIEGSTNWFCGIAPMLELKRSMVDEPMAEMKLGLFFSLPHPWMSTPRP